MNSCIFNRALIEHGSLISVEDDTLLLFLCPKSLRWQSYTGAITLDKLSHRDRMPKRRSIRPIKWTRKSTLTNSDAPVSHSNRTQFRFLSGKFGEARDHSTICFPWLALAIRNVGTARCPFAGLFRPAWSFEDIRTEHPSYPLFVPSCTCEWQRLHSLIAATECLETFAAATPPA